MRRRDVPAALRGTALHADSPAPIKETQTDEERIGLQKSAAALKAALERVTT